MVKKYIKFSPIQDLNNQNANDILRDLVTAKNLIHKDIQKDRFQKPLMKIKLMGTCGCCHLAPTPLATLIYFLAAIAILLTYVLSRKVI